MFWPLFVLVFCVWFGKYWWERRRIYDLAKQLPRTKRKCCPIVGHALEFYGNNEDIMTTLREVGDESIDCGGILAAWMGNKLYINISDAEVAEFLLKHCLDKGEVLMKLLRTFMGNASVFAPVLIWRPRRKILARVFSNKNLNPFLSNFVTQSIIMTEILEKHVGKGDFSIWSYINSFTFDTICNASLGIDLNAQKTGNNDFMVLFEEGSQIASRRLFRPWLYWEFVYKWTSEYKRYSKMCQMAGDFLDELIRKKKEEMIALNGEDAKRDGQKTFLELLIELSVQAGGYTDLELREELLGIISAGSDTSAVTTSFASVMLSRYPEIQEKVFQELQSVFGNSDRPLTVADLPKLVYLEAVIKETLRVYPAVPAYVREVTNDIQLPSGVTLVQGVGIVVNVFGIHRNPKYWGEDAWMFRPERWLEGPLRNPAQFVAFSYSVRNCIGGTYAMMSMKTVLSTMLRKYRLLPPSDLDPAQWTAPLRVEFDIMLRHVDKYMVRLEHRKKL